MILEMTAEISEQVLQAAGEELVPLSEQVLQVTEEELLPFLAEGIGAGVMMGTVFYLAAYGIVKAISLLHINGK